MYDMCDVKKMLLNQHLTPKTNLALKCAKKMFRLDQTLLPLEGKWSLP